MSDSLNEIKHNFIHFHDSNHMIMSEAPFCANNVTPNNSDLGPHNMELNTTLSQVSQNEINIQPSSPITTQLNAQSQDLRYRLKSTDNNINGNLKQTNDNMSQGEINFLFWNINRISDKLYDGCDIYELFSKYSVILLSETWLDPCDNISFNGYTVHNLARKTKNTNSNFYSGGIAVFIKDDCYNSIEVLKQTHDFFVWLRVKSSF
ncbi:unnamed protein product [Owenia fusiformis]|uniref:Uncharacterized protein n=1 Tax=Owenia fusiformis TaxID=6347 RepID=A0A8S4PRF0_OWEFU|nr:unnamed protein product [Owenia fusiformis]